MSKSQNNEKELSLLSEKSKKMKENNNYLKEKVKSSMRQQKLLMIALDRKRELDEEMNQPENDQADAKNQANLYNEMKLDNEVSKIIYQDPADNKKVKTSNKHYKSIANQESTEFATDEKTARISVKRHFESMDQNLPTTDSREIVLNTQTVPDNSLQNEDLSIVKPHLASTKQEKVNEGFINFIGELMSTSAIEDQEIITEIEKQVLIENKDFEDELGAIKEETKFIDDEIRELK
uniref:Uncharacterized protein n=1 Tax=Euplotes crassus TaxID=5936 RepID=A0A7S3NU71_EUPCR|mmetsp:Transcript_31729/g.31163  ORF Transcript_31729/g.31163 Transcript_31729/m.31163 type:complete len:236 (+) Transcript_31729:229-936(+)